MTTIQHYLNDKLSTKCYNYLDKNNCLSEFESEEYKKSARENLGIPEVINELLLKIDSKVIEQGGVAWDLVPTEGNTDKVLSSDSIYKVLSKYCLKDYLDKHLDKIWTNIIEKLKKESDKNNNELCQLVNYLKELISQSNISLELRIRTLEIKILSLLLSISGTPIVITDQFGDSDYLGINLKTLTRSINDIWEKLSEISGETYSGISLIVTPTYFIGENGHNVHVIATTENTNGIFEHLELYMNGEKFYEGDNIDYMQTDVHIDDTSIIMCKATILGIEYVKSKTITHYNSFWMGAGTDYRLIMNIDHIVPIGSKMKCNKDILVQDGDHIYIIVGDSLKERFIRADINGIEIPFIKQIVNVDDLDYVMYMSENIYNEGIYNIDINS